jgi:hypothetical protein
VETDVDVQSDEDPVGVETEEVHVPSAFCMKVDEPKVSHEIRGLLEYLFMCLLTRQDSTVICIFFCLENRMRPRVLKSDHNFYCFTVVDHNHWKTVVKIYL